MYAPAHGTIVEGSQVARKVDRFSSIGIAVESNWTISVPPVACSRVGVGLVSVGEGKISNRLACAMPTKPRTSAASSGRRFEEAARSSLNRIPGEVSLETEVRLLWWLAQAGHDAELAEALERITVPIPAGEFTMGDNTADPDERPQRSVYLNTFEIDPIS